jgi:hypothetical protein
MKLNLNQSEMIMLLRIRIWLRQEGYQLEDDDTYLASLAKALYGTQGSVEMFNRWIDLLTNWPYDAPVLPLTNYETFKKNAQMWVQVILGS